MKKRSPKNILVVDDDADLLLSFKELLETRGYTVDTANTGVRALEMSATNRYDAVIADIRLPDIEGTEVLRRMRQDPRNIKKIIITGYPSLENAIESITQGVDAYLLKPVEPTEFLKIVESKLKDKEKEEAFIENAVRQRMRMVEAESAKTHVRQGNSTGFKK